MDPLMYDEDMDEGRRIWGRTEARAANDVDLCPHIDHEGLFETLIRMDEYADGLADELSVIAYEIVANRMEFEHREAEILSALKGIRDRLRTWEGQSGTSELRKT